MTEPNLSHNEKVVFWGLTRFPSYNDRNLSQEIKIKMSTVTAIRNRLKRAGFYKTVRIPMLTRLGCELISIDYKRLNAAIPTKTAIQTNKRLCETSDSNFLCLCDNLQMLQISMHRNYTEMWSDNLRNNQEWAKEGIILESRNNKGLILPTASSITFNNFDFSRILAKYLGLKIPEQKFDIDFKPQDSKPRELSRIEKTVYFGLVSNPEVVDVQTGKKIGITRQSVTKIRKRFESEGLMRKVTIPNFQKLGFEILIVAFYEIAPNASMVNRKKAIDWVMKELPAFYHVGTNRDGVIMGLTRNYTETSKFVHDVSKLYLEKGIFEKEPIVNLMAVKEINTVKDFEFVAIVKKLLDIKFIGRKD